MRAGDDDALERSMAADADADEACALTDEEGATRCDAMRRDATR